ncbi:MAG: hypothetical protein CFH10_00706 [Alphaproteobacteria bacterium MarineAlpha4_Bin2]|nr:MAG: hypothetical protein CFH10_00706 [Alphaproteobacteria bacterium MarineAlpha4_Bin2]
MKGSVYIKMLNIESDLVPDNVFEWDVFNPPRYVQFFNSGNLKQLFQNYDFTVTRRFSGPKVGLRYLFRTH